MARKQAARGARFVPNSSRGALTDSVTPPRPQSGMPHDASMYIAPPMRRGSLTDTLVACHHIAMESVLLLLLLLLQLCSLTGIRNQDGFLSISSNGANKCEQCTVLCIWKSVRMTNL